MGRHRMPPYRQGYICQECGCRWFRIEWLAGGVLMVYCGESFCNYLVGSVDQRRGVLEKWSREMLEMIDQIQARELKKALWEGFRAYMEDNTQYGTGGEMDGYKKGYNEEMAGELFVISAEAWKYWHGEGSVANWLIPRNGGYHAA